MDKEYAFPHDMTHLHEPVTAGMTLRDYFAAKAMQGMCAALQRWDDPDAVPKFAYMMADAMLKARGKNEN